MNKKGQSLIAPLIVLTLALAAFVGLSMWTGRNLDFWISHFKGHAVHVPLWLDAAATICSGGLIFFLNIAGEIGRYFI